MDAIRPQGCAEPIEFQFVDGRIGIVLALAMVDEFGGLVHWCIITDERGQIVEAS
jgi:hypothetical protein